MTDKGDTASPSIKRRLAAILAADIAGYSRLMGQDEAGTFSTSRAIRGSFCRWSAATAAASSTPRATASSPSSPA